MADSGKDNSADGKPKSPAVRIRTVPKKGAEPPPGNPIIPPKPTGRGEVRIRLHRGGQGDQAPIRSRDREGAVQPPVEEPATEDATPIEEPAQETPAASEDQPAVSEPPAPAEPSAARTTDERTNTLDTNEKNKHRRMWWKYDIRVKAGLVPPENQGGQKG